MKELLNLENIIKVISGLFTYIALLATPEKLVLTSVVIMIVCIFAFSVWQYCTIRQSMQRETKQRELFERRFLLSESKIDLLIETHNTNHNGDASKFYELEKDQAQKRFNDEKNRVCGKCVNPAT